jgi:hypothetical protein
MGDLSTELSILEEKLAELREESTRWNDFQSPKLVATRMNHTVRDAGACEEECQERGKSPTLNSVPGKHTKSSAEKSTGQYLRDKYIDDGVSPCVYRGQDSIPKLDVCQEEEAAPCREHYQDFQEDDALAEYPVSRQIIKPATFDGSDPWRDYHAHFEACAELNAWKYNQRRLYLAVSLRGNAQGILGNIPKGTKPDYDTLVKALEDRFEPPSRTELYRAKMRERRQ